MKEETIIQQETHCTLIVFIQKVFLQVVNGLLHAVEILKQLYKSNFMINKILPPLGILAILLGITTMICVFYLINAKESILPTWFYNLMLIDVCVIGTGLILSIANPDR